MPWRDYARMYRHPARVALFFVGLMREQPSEDLMMSAIRMIDRGSSRVLN